MNEILLINKPAGWTSFDVVAKIRGLIKTKGPESKIKVGHSGTLDPFATGLLIILIGDYTKKQDEFMKLDKEYVATLRLGSTSTTHDPEGEITVRKIEESKIPVKSQIKKILSQFRGEIQQQPPIFSAIKIGGRRAYALARAGKSFEIRSRTVVIKNLKVIKFNWPILKILVECSSGTYIRSLANDIGNSLGCGAYLTDLKRTKIGRYNLSDAQEINKIILTQPKENAKLNST